MATGCTCDLAEKPTPTPSMTFHPSVQIAVARLKQLGVPILACGQTVFWDEPVKMVLREMLDALAPDVPMWIGIHDTDYFSRGSPLLSDKERFVPLPHNDFSTRDLWAAAVELSVLFGGETIPSHDDLASAGVSLEKAARAAGTGKQEFLDAITEAWGWRGLVCAGEEHPVSGQVPVADLWEPLVGLVRWAMEASREFLDSDGARRSAQQLIDLVLGWLQEWKTPSRQTSLAALYLHLLPRFCSLLLGRDAENVTFFTSSELLRLAPDTARKPRFHLLDLFLKPKTAPLARQAYDTAVRGSGIYELDKFGPGALPFDVVAPGTGRGTLLLTSSYLKVSFESGEVTIRTPVPVQDSLDLALALEKAFGKGVSLVGKAVALPLMFSAEFVMALHEGASAYVPLTKMMHRLLREKGLAFPLYPILRLRCCTWDALSTSDVRFQLPSHLASAFQKDRLSAQEFAATWQEVVDRQGALLDHLRSLKTPEELLAYLSTRDPAWKEQAEDWSNAHRALHEIGEWVKCYKMEVDSLSAAITSLNAEVADLDRRKGSLRRLESLDGPLAAATQLPWPSSSALLGQQPLPPAEDAEAQRQELDAQIRARHAAVRHRKAVLKRALAALREVENGDLAVKARKMIARVEASAELARARLARDALLVQGLARGNLRPTAWWFPLLDADCRWFKQVARTAQLSFEEFDAP